LALSKERKNDLLDQYRQWLEGSRAVVFAEYTGLTMKDIDLLRKNLRDAGAEFHIVKNTLGKIVFTEAGYPVKEDLFEGSTAVGYAFEDAPALAKVLSEFVKSSDFVKIKGGYLADKFINAAEVQALADLPPLPVMRARLMGTILAPASKLARILAEPGRQVAAVIKAYSEKESAVAEA